MAFNGAYLYLKTPAPPGVSQTWNYKTADAAADVDTANYFALALEMGMRIYDIIERVTVTNLGAANEAFSTMGLHVVNAADRAAGTIDVTDTTTLVAADTD